MYYWIDANTWLHELKELELDMVNDEVIQELFRLKLICK